MKKVLIFSTAYFPLVGGAEVAIKEITDRLDNFEFDMVTARLDRNLPKTERIGRVNVYRIGFGWPLFDKYLLACCGHKFAAKLNKKNKYYLIWAMMASYGGFAASFFKKANPAVPFLLTLQEGDDPEYINRRVGFLKNLFKQIFRRADYIQAISNYLADWAKRQGATCPIEVVPNGVDIKKFSIFSFQFSIKEFKNKLGFAEKDKVIITVSRLVKKNGTEDIVAAMKYLPENIKLLIVGSGELEEKLKLKIADLKLDSRVIMLGAIKNELVSQYLAATDIFVRPSLSEGQGIAFLEAMAASIPVIATPVGGIVDFLRDGQTGLFCRVNSPESIAEQVKRYLSDNALTDKIKNNASALIKEKYNWDLIVKKMKNIFEKL